MIINNHGFGGALRLSDIVTPEDARIAPTNTAQPLFTPPPSNGNESEVDDGEWDSSAPTTFEYQWQLDGVDIIGATFKTILVLVGMIGKTLRCAVKCINRYGFTVAFTVGIVVSI